MGGRGSGRLAEEARQGLPAADLRFESMPPVSAARQAAWARTSGFICHELVSSGITEVSPLMAQEMTRLAAAGLLETFPQHHDDRRLHRGPGLGVARCGAPGRGIYRRPCGPADHAGQHRRGGGHDGPGGAAQRYGLTA